jgi:hypothetical protein
VVIVLYVILLSTASEPLWYLCTFLVILYKNGINYYMPRDKWTGKWLLFNPKWAMCSAISSQTLN